MIKKILEKFDKEIDEIDENLKLIGEELEHNYESNKTWDETILMILSSINRNTKTLLEALYQINKIPDAIESIFLY